MSIVSCCGLCAAILRREFDMGNGPTITGATHELLKELGLWDIEVMRDDVLVVGLKQSFANLATPAGEQGPMDHPTKGIVLKCGPDCSDEKIGITPGMVVFFPKFSGVEIQVGTRRFFVVKAGVDVRGKQEVTAEELETLARNTY